MAVGDLITLIPFVCFALGLVTYGVIKDRKNKKGGIKMLSHEKIISRIIKHLDALFNAVKKADSVRCNQEIQIIQELMQVLKDDKND